MVSRREDQQSDSNPAPSPKFIPRTVGQLAPGQSFELETGWCGTLLYSVGDMRSYVRPLEKKHVVVRSAEGAESTFDRPGEPINIAVSTPIVRILSAAEAAAIRKGESQ